MTGKSDGASIQVVKLNSLFPTAAYARINKCAAFENDVINVTDTWRWSSVGPFYLYIIDAKDKVNTIVNGDRIVKNSDGSMKLIQKDGLEREISMIGIMPK